MKPDPRDWDGHVLRFGSDPHTLTRPAPLTLELTVTDSRRIAGLLGPTLLAVTITEWMNLDVFTAAIGPSFGPHVYLNGTLLFVAGLAIVRAHNYWTRGWPVLITLVGWIAIAGGLSRMVAPVSAQAAGRHPAVLYSFLIGLCLIGAVLTFEAYGRAGRGAD